MALAGGCGLLRRGAAGGGRSGCRSLPAGLAAPPRGRMALGLAASGAALLAAAALLVDRGPGPAFRFLLGHAPGLVAFLDVLRLALLLVGVAGLVAPRHGCLLS